MQDLEVRVSIIVPSYNYASFLDEALDSVLAQTLQEWECVVVDDGSTDHTAEVMAQWIARDSRFAYLQQENRGVSAARNTGISHSRGEFIQFLDADDLLSPNTLQSQLNIFAAHPTFDVVYGRFVFMSPDGSSFWQWEKVRSQLKPNSFTDFLLNWEKGLMIAPHCFLYRRSCFERWGAWDEQLETHEDWEIHLRFAAGGANYQHHDEVVAAYRKHYAGLASNPTIMRLGFLGVMLKSLAAPSTPTRRKPNVIFRYLEECFHAVLLKLHGRNIDLRKVFFNTQSFASNPGRVLRPWLNCAFALLLPMLVLMKLANMLATRVGRLRGSNKRIECSFPLRQRSVDRDGVYCGTSTRPSPSTFNTSSQNCGVGTTK